MNDKRQSQLSQGKKTLLEFLPLVAFFITYYKAGLMWATGVLLVCMLLSLIIQYSLTRTVSRTQIVITALVLVFGGLTLYLQDPFYFKIKVSIINGLLAMTLVFGLLTNRLFLRDIIGSSIEMPDSAWRTLSWRWVVFFLVLAVLNIVIWRNFSEPVWVNFKAYGLLVLTMLFALANAPFMAKHMVEGGPPKPGAPSA
jgi:intracellular septation protein